MKKKYLIPGLITLLILFITLAVKNIYPFGNKIIIWGDLHEQIVPLYYKFYDIFKNGKPLLINFTSLTASSNLTDFYYYIISPFTFIILLFSRSNIPYAVSIIVVLKIVLSSITFNYFIDKRFNKLNTFYKIVLSILYALSTYNLSLYIITGWIDIVYLFPIIMMGLYKLLDENNPKQLLISLTIAMICNFYITFMVIIFILLYSYIYVFFNKIDNKKSKILNLGLSILLTALLSSFVLIQIILQINSSARIGINLNGISNAITGPIKDKLLFFTSSMFPISLILLALFKYKENKNWIKPYLLITLLLIMPTFIEPINKMWHFGSYICYPYRFGFITTFVLLIFSAEVLTRKELIIKKLNYNIIPIVSTIFSLIITIILTKLFYNEIQSCIDYLSFSINTKAFLILMIICLINLISFAIINITLNNNKLKYLLLSIIILVFSFSQTMLYIQIDYDEHRLNNIYSELNEIYNSKEKTDYNYSYKINDYQTIKNYGMIIDEPTQDYFTSLINNSSFEAYQRLGYSSLWMNTSSYGGNYFIDKLLGNKFIIDNNYIYENNLVSNAYIIDNNIDISKYNNSFDLTNDIYKSNTNSNNNIFNIYRDFKTYNLELVNNTVNIIDKNIEAYIEKDIIIKEDEILYLEILKDYINKERNKIKDSYDIYINDVLYETKDKNEETSIELKTNKNEKINIKIKFYNNISFKDISLGVLNKTLTDQYFSNNYKTYNITYNNKININIDSEKDGILFIPKTYLNGMTSNYELIKVYNNFIGVKINKGINNIEINYLTPGLKTSLIISILGLLLTILYLKYYSKLINNKIINFIIYKLYTLVFICVFIVIYIIPCILLIKDRLLN